MVPRAMAGLVPRGTRRVPRMQLRGFSEVLDHSAYLNMILNAKVYDVCKRTDLHFAPGLSKSTGSRVFLKREDQQSVYSFKLRGAYNKIVNLTPEEKAMGICACSAGNHAQGVAFSAAALDISAKIFMPQTTPNIKVDAARRFSNPKSEVILVGDNYDAAYAATLECMKLKAESLCIRSTIPW